MPDAITPTPTETPKATESTETKNTLITEEKPAQGTEGKPEVKEQVAPVVYDLKLPDGSLLDAAHVEKFQAYAKENKFSNEQAQSFLAREHAVIADFVTGQKANLAKQADIWVGEVKADKEIGGDKFNENVELAKRVVKRYGSEKLINSLNDTGLGNHPELIRAFAKIGKEMGEDKLVIGGVAQKKPPQRVEDLFYPSNAKE